MEAINLETGEYSASKKINIKSDKVDLKTLIQETINMGICLVSYFKDY